MFVRYLTRGFAAGLGFAIGFLLLTMLVPTLFLHLARSPIRIDVPSAPSSSSIAPVPAAGVTATEPKPFSLRVGKPPEMTIPEGGGIAYVAIVKDNATSGRPVSVQYWLTADQLWRIDTRGDSPTFAKLDYPAGDPAESVEKRLRAEVFEETGMTSAIDRAGLGRIDRGIQDPAMNGVSKRNADGVVWFLPNPR